MFYLFTSAYTELSISFDRVSIKSPAGKTLLTDLRFTIEQNKNVIILGPNGSGKTSILRTMSGLWPAYEGTVNLPHATVRQKLLVYLPQTPYLTYGSLRDQITYPVVNSFRSSSSKYDNLYSQTSDRVNSQAHRLFISFCSN